MAPAPSLLQAPPLLGGRGGRGGGQRLGGADIVDTQLGDELNPVLHLGVLNELDLLAFATFEQLTELEESL